MGLALSHRSYVREEDTEVDRGGYMNRITPEIALEAYENTGLRPKKEMFFDNESYPVCACAIGAVFVFSGNIADELGAEMSAKTLYGWGYTVGFQKGFDGWTEETITENEVTGFIDGRATWEAVKHLADPELLEAK